MTRYRIVYFIPHLGAWPMFHVPMLAVLYKGEQREVLWRDAEPSAIDLGAGDRLLVYRVCAKLVGTMPTDDLPRAANGLLRLGPIVELGHEVGAEDLVREVLNRGERGDDAPVH